MGKCENCNKIFTDETLSKYNGRHCGVCYKYVESFKNSAQKLGIRSVTTSGVEKKEFLNKAVFKTKS